MHAWHVAILAVALSSSLPAMAQAQAQNLKGMEQSGQRNDTQPMTAAQQAEYQFQYQAAKAKWATMTPQEKQATIASARTKKLSDLSAVELVGQRDDMQRETAAQTAQSKAARAEAEAKWAAMTPEQKRAVRRSAWGKKRGDLDGTEAVGQRDDSYVLPY